MTINLKNFLSDKSKLSKMGEFQDLKPLDGLEVSSISADLYNNGRDDLALFYFREGANYATLTTSNSIVSETISWNEKSNKKSNIINKWKIKYFFKLISILICLCLVIIILYF